MAIRKIKARQILDSRGLPTIEVDLITDIGLLRSSVPSSMYPSLYGARTLRDDEDAYNGASVRKVVYTINNVIAPEIFKSKLEVHQQREIDDLMINLDGTVDRSKLGANAMIGVSIACCKAAAAMRGMPIYKYIAEMAENETILLPVPHINLVTGGRAGGNNLVYEQFNILPVGAETFTQALQMVAEVTRIFDCNMVDSQDNDRPYPVLDLGGFMPEFEENKNAISAIETAIYNAGYAGKVQISLEINASSFYVEEKYDLEYKTGESDPDDHLDSDGILEHYNGLLNEFSNVVSLADPFELNDWDSWPVLVSEKPDIQVVADDFIDMNPARLQEAIDKKAANCIVIRFNAVGTVSEALDMVKKAREAGWSVLVSSGQTETEDTFVSDFAVGISSGQIKCGAICRGERISKYNQILRIEEELGKQVKYAGDKFRFPFGRKCPEDAEAVEAGTETT